ncbi:hypothetical protein AURDEDRAFT_158423 [Auricularia subglabra TFB-10046 SS5]|nr:hypothetical protein AURDEDRAFT_158423 [Auricularia subglabra TFB-10046 SS5]
MSVIPEIILARLESLATNEDAIQHPQFAASQLTFHQPLASDRDSFGSWSVEGFMYEFRLIGQLSAHQTFVGPYGDMHYHKQKERYAGPWRSQDVMRAKRKLSIALPLPTSDSQGAKVLSRQYKHLDEIQMLNFKEAVDGFAVRSRVKSSFAIRTGDQWRVSAVSDNIFHPAGGSAKEDRVPFDGAHDPEEIISRIKGLDLTGLTVEDLPAFDDAGKAVPSHLLCTTFRPGYWVELYCKLRVWTNSTPGEHTRSYHVVTDAVQLLAKGSLREGTVTSQPLLPPRNKRKFEAVGDLVKKRVRVQEPPTVPGALESAVDAMQIARG